MRGSGDDPRTPGDSNLDTVLDRALIDSLFPADLPDPAHWEERYPPRALPAGAEVTRFGPSPTGFVHIGGLYVATIDRDVATHSGGVYIVRVEDTDQSREVEGALAQFDRAFAYFDLAPDEADDATRRLRPVPPVAARADLPDLRAGAAARRARPTRASRRRRSSPRSPRASRRAKLPTGYYGRWALWRDAAPEDVAAKLAGGRALRGPVPGARARRRRAGELRRRDPRQAVARGEPQRRGDPQVVRPEPAPAHLPLRARRRRPPDAGHARHPQRGVDQLGAAAPAAVRRAGASADHLRAHRPADEADPRRQAEALQAQGPRGERRLLHRRGLPGPGRPVLPARAGQRAAGRAAAGRGARHADPARPVRDGGPAGRPGQAGGHQRRPHRHAARRRRPRRRHRVGAGLRPRAGRGAGHRTRPRAARHRRRAGRGGQPAQGPAQVVGLPRRVRLLLPRVVHAARRADRRAGGGGVGGRRRRRSRRSSPTSSTPTGTSTTRRSGSTRSAPRAPATGSPRARRSTRPTRTRYHGSIREASQLVRLALTGSTRSPDMHAVAQALGPDEVLARLAVLADRDAQLGGAEPGRAGPAAPAGARRTHPGRGRRAGGRAANPVRALGVRRAVVAAGRVPPRRPHGGAAGRGRRAGVGDALHDPHGVGAGLLAAHRGRA